MTKTKAVLGSGMLAFLLAGGSSAFAFGRGMGEDHACGAGMLLGGRVLHALDLSTDQQQKVQDILAAHRPKLHQLAANEKAAAQALADQLLGTNSVTQQDFDAALQRASQAHDDLMRERLAAALAVRHVLTSDHIQKAAAMRTGMQQLHAQMRQLLGQDDTD